MSSSIWPTSDALARITYFESFDTFYVTLIGDDARRRELDQRLRLSSAAFDVAEKTDLAVHDVCVANNGNDDVWRRGKILGQNVAPHGVEECEVFFVDEGNVACLPNANLRALPKALHELCPPLAIPCALDGLEEQHLRDEEDAQAIFLMFFGALNKAPFLLRPESSKSSSVLRVSLSLLPSDLIEADEPVDALDVLRFFDVLQPKLRIVPNFSKVIPSAQHLALNSRHSVHVCHVEEKRFFVRRHVDLKAFKMLCAQMKTHYKRSDVVHRMALVSDGASAGVWHEKRYLRCQVVSVEENRQWTHVHMVDTGETIKVQTWNILKLPDKFAAIKALAHCCIVKKEWERAKLTDAFRSNSLLDIEIQERSQGQNVITLSLCKDEEDKSSNEVNDAKEQSVQGERDEPLKSTENEKIRPFLATRVVDPWEVHVRPQHCQGEFDGFYTRITQVLSKLIPSPETPAVNKGDIVGVRRCGAFKSYARGEVLNSDDQLVKVLLVDTGEQITVPLVNLLYPLPESLKRPRFSHCIKMSYVEPLEECWTFEAKETLRNLLESQATIYLKGIEKRQESEGDLKKVPMEIYITERVADGPFGQSKEVFRSVSKILIEKNLAKPTKLFVNDKSKENDFLSDESQKSSSSLSTNNAIARNLAWKPPRLPTESSFTGTLSFIDSEGQLYVAPEGTAKEVVTEWEQFFKKESFKNEDEEWSIGDPCIAFHPNQEICEGWFRGMVTEVYEDDVLGVLFVDYGDWNLVSTQFCSKKINHKCLQASIACLRCVLHNVLPRGSRYSTEILQRVIGSFGGERRLCIKIVDTDSQAFPLKVEVKSLGEKEDMAELFIKNGARKATSEEVEAFVTPEVAERREQMAQNIQPQRRP